MDELKAKRDEITTKIFWLGLQIAFIFAIPAVIGAIVGVNLDAIYKTGRLITVAILIVAFFFSWTVVILKYRKLNKELKEINKNRIV